MTASTEPRGGLDLGWSSGEDGWGDAMNANLLRLSRLGFHPSVLSATIATPPGSPISGSGYIIPSGATGVWAGKTGQVAIWDGTAWAYAVPRDGWTMHVDGTGLVAYEDGVWSQENAIKPAAIGAEPYAGVPAQTSFWKSTAAGVRSWAQLVAEDVGAPPSIALSGTVDAKALNGGKAGLYRLAASAYTNFWTGITAGQQASVLQLESPTGLRTLIASDNKAGGLLTRFQASDFPGDDWSDWYTLWDSGNLPVGTTGRAVLATTTQAAARAAISAAKAPSKVDISASTTLGAIDATAIKVTATDVILTLSGGVDGQGWDIVCPTVSFGISIPTGVTLYAYSGFDIGPTPRAVGGGRGIRIVRIDAATWIAPNLTW